MYDLYIPAFNKKTHLTDMHRLSVACPHAGLNEDLGTTAPVSSNFEEAKSHVGPTTSAARTLQPPLFFRAFTQMASHIPMSTPSLNMLTEKSGILSPRCEGGWRAIADAVAVVRPLPSPCVTLISRTQTSTKRRRRPPDSGARPHLVSTQLLVIGASRNSC